MLITGMCILVIILLQEFAPFVIQGIIDGLWYSAIINVPLLIIYIFRKYPIQLQAQQSSQGGLPFILLLLSPPLFIFWCLTRRQNK